MEDILSYETVAKAYARNGNLKEFEAFLSIMTPQTILFQVDPDTGLIIDEGENRYDSFTKKVFIYAKNIYNQERKRIEANKQITKTPKWFASFHKKLEIISPRISLISGGIIMTLLPYMEKNTGYLKINGERMTKSDMEDVLGLKKDAVRKHLQELKSYKIINWVRTKEERIITKGKYKGTTNATSSYIFKIDPQFHMYGSFGDKKHTKVFRTSAKEQINMISLEARGLLYKVLHKVHYQSYFLSDQPDFDLRTDKTQTLIDSYQVTDGSQIGILKDEYFITRNRLKDISGRSEKTVRRYIKEWEYARIVQQIGRGKHTAFLLNPNVLTRQKEIDPIGRIIVNFIFGQGPNATKAPND